MMVDAAFWFIVVLTLGSACMVVLNEKLIYSAIALLFTLFGVAALYVFLWADFLAGVQVMIYVGGILVLIIFGIMLTNRITSVNISHTSVQKGIGGMVVLGILFVLGIMILNTPWLHTEFVEPAQTTATIGTLLMMEYLLPFEVASLLLLAALMGAAMLSRRDD
ncbi:MAG TPA: NADH-quinone oxidoreductase subunit J [Candidatus Marinimicrobia bacterium]|jgi:NADH-quinone oxidoreductase subunit J|nr:NADH-quinone oxidoreductase subunit J [Candidatus Neomarinimicrobiota bacterium]MDP7094804.1 NADH-quinone oxidoreductase subunit J [Candidatus Neomarinimicrobiota bacterium]MDP7166064.1 NADH-quinone oxidoreductase subunit J [Candidatus Neomarinimicrobiota bacterium]MDP7512966.1 NADH-quinone oxidoreductase subunit J [Candidatus Neomarinimicrobiota bacterium]HBR86737.1 NADH-quinone oxidoreductase subunit J [Candidatus Neomarinimicrobiota bacterium]|tara:strand:- start:225 stop:716 length:492 start_codon:yes stop_codon:yes gene_type:complete